MTISQKRQRVIADDANVVRAIYSAACKEWGKDKVDKDHTRVWDLRCMMGIRGQLPFGGSVLACTNLGEVLWVLENVVLKEVRR